MCKADIALSTYIKAITAAKCALTNADFNRVNTPLCVFRGYNYVFLGDTWKFLFQEIKINRLFITI